MATAFNSQGATPSPSFGFTSPAPVSPFGFGKTPAATALNRAQTATPPAPAPVAPTTPVKKTTVNNVDGSSHVTEYHAPTPGLLASAPAAATDPAGGGGHAVIPTAPVQTNQSTGGNAVIPTGGSEGTPVAPGSIQPNPAPQPTASTSYAGLLGTLANRGTQDSPEVIAARNALKQSQMNQADAEATNRLNPIPIGDQTGREAVIRNQYLAQENALTGVLNSSVTTQGQQIGALENATSQAQPIQLPYSNQLVNPQTGQPTNGGASGNLQDAVSTVAQRIQSGEMSYDQGVSALGGYGQGGINALQQALGPNFNVAQSNALAGQQGTIGPAYTYAKTAISNLQNAVAGLSSAQNTNIPIVNMITQGLSTTFGVGAQGVQAYKGALAEARSAIQKVLASVQGGTPTDYVGQSNALLPDNATPAQIAAASQTLDTLGQAKVDIYGNPGSSTTNTNQNAQSTNNPPGWF